MSRMRMPWTTAWVRRSSKYDGRISEAPWAGVWIIGRGDRTAHRWRSEMTERRADDRRGCRVGSGCPGGGGIVAFLVGVGMIGGLFPLSPAAAADVHFSRESWDQRAGLPDGIVRGLVRAPDGSLAVGSDRGLVRFDGRRGWPVSLTQPVDDVPTIKRMVGMGDTLVVLLRDGGLVVLRAGRQRFLNAAAARAAAATPPCSVTSLCSDAVGNVWVALGDGSVGRFAGLDAREGSRDDAIAAAAAITWFTPVGGMGDGDSAAAELLFDPGGTAAAGERSRSAASGGTVWLASGGGLFAFRSDTAGFERVAAIPTGPVQLALRRDGGLWIATGGEGGEIGRLTAGVYRRVAAGPSSSVASLCEDDTGRLWIGTTRSGLFHAAPTAPNSGAELKLHRVPVSGRGVHALLPDGAGGVWAGTTAGIDHVQPSVTWLVGPPTPRLPRALGTAGDDLWFITQAGDVGTWRAAVTEAVDDTIRPRLDMLDAAVGWRWGAATCLATTPDGRVLVGTERSGVVALRNEPVRFDSVPLPPEVAGQRIDILRGGEGKGDDLWLVADAGLFARRDGGWTRCDVAGGHVRQLAVDPVGGAWAATADGGVVRFEPGGGSGRVWTLGAGGEISAVCPTGDGSAWVAVVDAGLFRVRDDGVVAVGSAEGLESLRIIAAALDGHGRLWCVCGRRLMVIGLDALAAAADRLGPCRPLMIDGTDAGPFPDTIGGFLPTDPGADDRGRLWLAAHERLVVCDPAALDLAPRPAPLRVEQMTVDGRVVGGGAGTGGFGHPVAWPPRLPPEPRVVEFVISPPGGGRAGATLEHRLVGIDDAWSPTPADGSVRYSRLPAGDHALELRSVDAQGRRSAAVAATRFAVPPRWWERGWVRAGFVTGVAAVAALGGLSLASRRARRRLDRLEREAAVERERARIARDIHDEVGTSLTQVALLAELALGDADPTAAAGRLAEVVRISRRTVTSIDEVIWSVNPANDSLPGLLEHLAQSVLDTLGPLGVACAIELPEAVPPLAAPAEFRRDVLLAVKEACANVAKHAAAGAARFTAEVHCDRLRLALADDGVGLPEALPAGDGLANMRRRAGGLGGSCIIERRRGGGTVVTLEVPLPHGAAILR